MLFVSPSLFVLGLFVDYSAICGLSSISSSTAWPFGCRNIYFGLGKMRLLKDVDNHIRVISVNNFGMIWKVCCFVSCTTQWMQRHATSHLENKRGKAFGGDQVAGRQKPAHHQEYFSDICGGCIQCAAMHQHPEVLGTFFLP